MTSKRKTKAPIPLCTAITSEGVKLVLKGKKALVYHHLIAHGNTSVSDLATTLNISKDHVMDTLRRLRLADVVVRVPVQYSIAFKGSYNGFLQSCT